MEETGAGVLGAGIVDGGGIGPVEGTETVGISHRKVKGIIYKSPDKGLTSIGTFL